MVIAKTHHLRQSRTIMASRFDPIDVANGCQRSDRFYNQANKLHYAPTILKYSGMFCTLEQMRQSVRCGLELKWHQLCKAFLSKSNLVSRRASKTPNQVCTMQPPRVPSGELWNR